MSGSTGRESYASKANQNRFGEINGAVLIRILFEQTAISCDLFKNGVFGISRQATYLLSIHCFREPQKATI